MYRAMRFLRPLAIVLPALLWVLPGYAADLELNYKKFGGSDGPSSAAMYIARTTAEWEGLWNLLGVSPPQALREGKETGVGIFLGTRPTAGYGIEIRRIDYDDGRIEVKMREEKPDGAAAQVVTSPYVILLIEGTGRKAIVDNRIDLKAPPAAIQ